MATETPIYEETASIPRIPVVTGTPDGFPVFLDAAYIVSLRPRVSQKGVRYAILKFAAFDDVWDIYVDDARLSKLQAEGITAGMTIPLAFFVGRTSAGQLRLSFGRLE